VCCSPQSGMAISAGSILSEPQSTSPNKAITVH
jgi:hypothetical protein